MERCGDLWVREPELSCGRWLSGRTEEELHLEIGCGKGRFTVLTAASLPSVLLVAIEKTQNVLLTAMERTEALGLSNIRFLDVDASGLASMFALGEVSRIYLNFSDPWPGQRYEKRRLTSPRFLSIYGQILRPGGEIHFKTDNRGLFDYSIAQFPAAGYDLEQVTYDLHGPGICGVMTDYEEKFHEAGTPICRCVARWRGENSR